MKGLRVLIGTVVVALAAASGALAHGDPTGHYLETDALLTSYAAPPSLDVELQLRGVIDEAAKRGYPIKVVLIANEGDTGGEPAPLEDTQAYVHTISGELDGIKDLRAPVLIVTPHGFGLGGIQPSGGTLKRLTDARAAELLRGVAPAGKVDGDRLARTAIVTVRRLAANGGHRLPARIAPAKQNLNGILGTAASRDTADWGGPWVIATVVGGTALLLGAMLLAVARRAPREPEPGL
jgi:hypothetical protein